MQSSRMKNILFLLVAVTFLTSLAASEWTISAFDSPFDRYNVSNNTDTVKIIEITDGSDPVNQSRLEDDPAVLNYIYNATSGPKIEMEWLHSGYYTAQFKPNATKGGEIEFELRDDSSGGFESNTTENMSFGNMTVNMTSNTRNFFSERVKFGKTFTANVSVTDAWNNQDEDEATVYAYFTNLSSSNSEIQSRKIELGRNNGYYTNTMDVPDNAGARYVFWVQANSSSVSYENAYGSTATVVETLPKIKGEIDYLNASSGCDQETFFSECEWGAEVETGFNVTKSAANMVNLSVKKKEISSGNWVDHSSTELEKNNGLYHGEFTVPDINTSKYEKTIRLQYNASSDEREFIKNYDVDYRTFKIRDKSDAVTGPGSYTVQVETTKYFTPTPLNGTRMNGTVDIDAPSGNDFRDFTLGEMEYSENRGEFRKTINIPFDGETGIYRVNITAWNTYDDRKTEMSSFDVKDIENTFNISEDEHELEIDKIGVHEFNVTLENLRTSESTLTYMIEEEFGENVVVEVNNGSDITLASEEEKNVTVGLNVSYVDSYTGDIKFMDEEANYNQTVEVDIEAPDCDYRNSTVCIDRIGSFSVSSDERETISRSLTAYYLGEKDTESDFQVSATGNISQYLTFDPSSMDMNEVNDSENVEVNFSVERPGYFNGTVEVSNEEYTASFDAELNSDVEATESSIQLPQNLDIGSVPSGEGTTKELQVRNTGQVAINSVEFSSERFEIATILDGAEVSSISLEPDETVTVTLEFSGVEAESGEIQADVSTDFEDYSETIVVTASLVPDYISMTGDLERRLINLDADVEDEDLQSQLNDAQAKTSDIKSAYRQGNYDEAESLYNEVSSTADQIERQVQSQSDSDPGDDQQRPGTGSGDPGSLTGSSPFIPIAISVFVLLIIGFVAYTSLIPEEGDPLYNVLGK